MASAESSSAPRASNDGAAGAGDGREAEGPSARVLWLFRLVIAVLLVALLELGSYAIILVSSRIFDEPIRRTRDVYREQSAVMRRFLETPAAHVQLDSILGWRYRAGFRNERDTMNAQGLRSGRDYATAPADSVLRVAAFGDSFVYGNEVTNDGAWATRVERLDSRIEMLNYGVGGYGDDQGYLRFMTEGTKLAPRIVVLGFVTDDLRRMVNVYRRFISTREVPLFKPRYLLRADSTLTLLPTPTPTLADYSRYIDDPSAVRGLGANDQWYDRAMYDDPMYDYSATVRVSSFFWTRVYRRYLDPERLWRGKEMNTRSTAFRLQTEIFARFVRSADSSGLVPVLLFFPDHESVSRRLAGQPTLYSNLVREVARRGLPYLDAAEAFAAVPNKPDVASWFASGGHYSTAGNEVVAAWLAKRLASYRPIGSRGGTPPRADAWRRSGAAQ